MTMWTRTFWAAAAERGVKTFAQTAAAIGRVSRQAAGLLETDWTQVGSVAGMAAVVSLLTSIGSAAVIGSPSLLTAEVPADQVVAVQRPGQHRLTAGPASPLDDGTPVRVTQNLGLTE